MTSSPDFNLLSLNFGEVKAERAKRLAEEPELVKRQCFRPKNFANGENLKINLFRAKTQLIMQAGFMMKKK